MPKSFILMLIFIYVDSRPQITGLITLKLNEHNKVATRWLTGCDLTEVWLLKETGLALSLDRIRQPASGSRFWGTIKDQQIANYLVYYYICTTGGCHLHFLPQASKCLGPFLKRNNLLGWNNSES